ncbi:MAG: T9SS type A sorting domain-containing protein [Bacteroidia bacterium]
MKKIYCCLLSAFAISNVEAQNFNLLWSDSSNVTNDDDRARQNAIDSSGIYIVGNDNQPGNNQWRIEKRNLYTGKMIWVQTVNPSAGNDYAQDIVVFDTALYISGYENISGTDYQWRLEKRSPTTGALIWVETSNPSTGGDVGFGVCANDSGVFMVGADYVLGKNQWRIERRDLVSGNLTWAKNTDGATTGSTAQALHVAADDSSIYVCGFDAAPGTGQWHIEKRNITTGDTIWTKVNDYSAARYDYAQDIAMDASGIYIVGSDFSLSSTDNQWNIEKRDLITGDTIWTQKSNASIDNDFATAVTLDTDYMYAAGFQGTSSNGTGWRIEKRDKVTGTIFCSQVNSPGISANFPAGISVDASGVYVSGDDAIAAGNFEWRIQKYSLCTLQATPQAFFNISDSTLCEGDCISITDSSTNNPVVWNWIMNGANPSNSVLQNPANVCYDSSGTFTVTLITANGSGIDSTTKIITVQNCLGISPLTVRDNFFLFPNPAHDQFTINSYPDTKKTLLLKLSNIAGITVLETAVSNNPISISHLMPGIYIYTFYTPEGIIARGKLSKQ